MIFFGDMFGNIRDFNGFQGWILSYGGDKLRNMLFQMFYPWTWKNDPTLKKRNNYVESTNQLRVSVVGNSGLSNKHVITQINPTSFGWSGGWEAVMTIRFMFEHFSPSHIKVWQRTVGVFSAAEVPYRAMFTGGVTTLTPGLAIYQRGNGE